MTAGYRWGVTGHVVFLLRWLVSDGELLAVCVVPTYVTHILAFHRMFCGELSGIYRYLPTANPARTHAARLMKGQTKKTIKVTDTG